MPIYIANIYANIVTNKPGRSTKAPPRGIVQSKPC